MVQPMTADIEVEVVEVVEVVGPELQLPQDRGDPESGLWLLSY